MVKKLVEKSIISPYCIASYFMGPSRNLADCGLKHPGKRVLIIFFLVLYIQCLQGLMTNRVLGDRSKTAKLSEKRGICCQKTTGHKTEILNVKNDVR